jgi:two-component system response regulator NreC
MPDLHLAPDPAESELAALASSPIRIVVADDHALMRHSLRLTLDGEEDIEVVAEAGDIESTVRHVHLHEPRVLVLALNMRGSSSIETIGELRRRLPDMEVVVLSMNDSAAFARHALASGALGFVLKEHADSDLPHAICAAARGQRYISPRVTWRGEAQQQAG